MQAIEAMRRLDDGSIVVAGTAQAYGPLTAFVAKLDADGSLDGNFGADGDGIVRLGGAYFHALSVDGQGRVIAAGEKNLSSVMHAIVARFNSDGTLDANFGTGGLAMPGPSDPAQYSYVNALALAANDRIVVGGFRAAEAPEVGDAYWVASLNADGSADANFGDAGSRSFRIPDSVSTYNGIQRLLALESGEIVFGAYYMSDTNGTCVVLGRLAADGSTDATFGDQTTPGFQRIDAVPNAGDRYISGLERQADGKLLATINYYTPPPNRQNFLAVRTLPNGVPDTGFGTAGIFEIDLAPDGVYSSSTALTLQNGNLVLAGSTERDVGSPVVDLAVLRFASDRIFADDFDNEAPPVITLSNYDAFAEGFLGATFADAGVTYREANEVDGAYPDGVPFAAGELGTDFIIENATILYLDFPQYGSAPNSLAFGNTYINGDNLSIGPLSSAWLDVDQVATAVSVDLAYYENGPWGGIEIALDAYRSGVIVGTDTLIVAGDDPGHDNVTTATLSIDTVEFDSLHLRAQLDGVYTAPRVMIDNLAIARAPAGP